MLYKRFLCITLALSMFLSVGCTSNKITNMGKVAEGTPISTSDDKLLVYTTFYTLYDFAKKIGKDKVKVVNLISANTEIHHYEPTVKDITKLKNADILIYNGVQLDGWVGKLVKSSNNKNLTQVEASKNVYLLESGNRQVNSKESVNYDPHVWLDPNNALEQMREIRDAFIKKDSQNKEYYEKNFGEMEQKVMKLDSDYYNGLMDCTKKDLIVTHGAFLYLCNAFGLSQVAVNDLDAESEPNPARIAKIIDFIKENDVTTIFFEKSSGSKVANVISKEAGVKIDTLSTLEELNEDDLNAGRDYFYYMNENLKVLERALK